MFSPCNQYCLVCFSVDFNLLHILFIFVPKFSPRNKLFDYRNVLLNERLTKKLYG